MRTRHALKDFRLLLGNRSDVATCCLGSGSVMRKYINGSAVVKFFVNIFLRRPRSWEGHTMPAARKQVWLSASFLWGSPQVGALIGCLLLPGIGLLLIFNLPQTGGGLWQRGSEQEDSDFQGDGEGDSCCRRQCTAYILLVLVTSYGLAFQFQEDVVWLLGEEMKKFEDVNGFVIDGFPANLNQGSIIHYSIQFQNKAILSGIHIKICQ